GCPELLRPDNLLSRPLHRSRGLSLDQRRPIISSLERGDSGAVPCRCLSGSSGIAGDKQAPLIRAQS
ncbi:hypothetical protein AVEN_244049-1, partial [Araneus ventricosus]